MASNNGAEKLRQNTNLPGERTKFLLDEEQIPRRWYNIQADLPTPLPPVLHPGTNQPIGPADRIARQKGPRSREIRPGERRVDHGRRNRIDLQRLGPGPGGSARRSLSHRRHRGGFRCGGLVLRRATGLRAAPAARPRLRRQHRPGDAGVRERRARHPAARLRRRGPHHRHRLRSHDGGGRRRAA